VDNKCGVWVAARTIGEQSTALLQRAIFEMEVDMRAPISIQDVSKYSSIPKSSYLGFSSDIHSRQERLGKKVVGLRVVERPRHVEVR
jgi:hypothetical protein